MLGLLDVHLRGALLVLVALGAGGVAWVRLVLRAEPHAKPDAATAAALRLTALAAAGAAVAQAASALLVAARIEALADPATLGAWLGTSFARVALGRAALAAGLAALAARLARRPAGPAAWRALEGLAAGLVLAAQPLSHAAARLEDRLWLGVLGAAHHAAAAVWVGGLAQLTLHAARTRREPDPRTPGLARRFSRLALGAVVALVGSGAALGARYVGDPGGLVGTAYGIMVLVKGALLLAALVLAGVNARLVRRAPTLGGTRRLARLVEAELGLALTALLVAGSLTSLPPAVDLVAERAAPAEVLARFQLGAPRLAGPPIAQLLREADPLLAPVGERKAVERAWSETNHHWAGLVVLVMGGLACLERVGWRAARHWPLAFLALAAFLFVRSDPRAWPLGPAGVWESMLLPDVLQHRLFIGLIVGFALFEWAVRTGRLAARPWAFVFPALCAVGGALLLAHSHAMADLKAEFLTEVTHAPLGLLGVLIGWARWLEVRLPEAGPAPGWVWRGALAAVGALLLLYREG